MGLKLKRKQKFKLTWIKKITLKFSWPSGSIHILQIVFQAVWEKSRKLNSKAFILYK